jgi:hypothetical protein
VPPLLDVRFVVVIAWVKHYPRRLVTLFRGVGPFPSAAYTAVGHAPSLCNELASFQFVMIFHAIRGRVSPSQCLGTVCAALIPHGHVVNVARTLWCVRDQATYECPTAIWSLTLAAFLRGQYCQALENGSTFGDQHEEKGMIGRLHLQRI